MARLVLHRVRWYAAPLEGARMVGRSLEAVVIGLGSIVKELVFEGRTRADVSGPVGIFFITRQTQALGISYLLQLVAILSINLAVLNFLPIPALDGGRILFLLVERLRGKRVNPRLENAFHAAGFAFLVLLMILVTYRDVARIL
jgi:regulator of sigma E protease